MYRIIVPSPSPERSKNEPARQPAQIGENRSIERGLYRRAVQGSMASAVFREAAGGYFFMVRHNAPVTAEKS